MLCVSSLVTRMPKDLAVPGRACLGVAEKVWGEASFLNRIGFHVLRVIGRIMLGYSINGPHLTRFRLRQSDIGLSWRRRTAKMYCAAGVHIQFCHLATESLYLPEEALGFGNTSFLSTKAIPLKL